MDWIAAINQRHLVSFRYEGHPRVVIPAAYGLHVTEGTPVLRGYQVRGSSLNKDVPFWELFKIILAVDPVVLDERFLANPPQYVREDRHMALIYAQL